MLIPSSRMTAVRAPRWTGELFVVIELPIARHYRVLVNHKCGEAFRLRTFAPILRVVFRANFLPRHNDRRRAITDGRLPSLAEPHHLGRCHYAFVGVSASD